LRWNHPLRGPISPGAFIPLAEESGLITQLGAWALHEACREAASWPGDLRVAVNVSAVQFRKTGLEQSVMRALAASGLPAGRLELEITESVLMQDSDAVIGSLHRLRAMGVRIALDDFGTGYSSLSYLCRFPFDKIKIDRAFIRDIDEPWRRRWCARWWVWASASAWPSPPRAWRRRSSWCRCGARAAPRCRASCSAARCPPRRP
jgi:EAL domain-containing protein (putative c-di-GMP-specific phosphodiesterase class I)